MFFYSIFSLKSKKEVHKEVPKCYHCDGKNFNYVKIVVSFAKHQIYYSIVNAQTNKRNNDKQQILCRDVGVSVLKCPHTIE